MSEKDYLAICLIGGGSAWGRPSSKEKALALCKRELEQEWSQLFHLHGKTIGIPVFDVTGHKSISWDHQGMHADGQKIDPPMERIEVTLKVPKKYRRDSR